MKWIRSRGQVSVYLGVLCPTGNRDGNLKFMPSGEPHAYRKWKGVLWCEGKGLLLTSRGVALMIADHRESVGLEQY